MNSKNYLIILILCISISCFDKKNEDIPKQKTAVDNCVDIDNTPENYQKNCQCIEDKKISFPSEKVIKAKIFKNKSKELGAFIKDKGEVLDKNFIKQFNEIVSDTSNFIWGESKPISNDFLIEFYNEKEEMINQAFITKEGTIWTLPFYKKTKSGITSIKGKKQFDKIFKKQLSEK